jgi:hypothetical protein
MKDTKLEMESSLPLSLEDGITCTKSPTNHLQIALKWIMELEIWNEERKKRIEEIRRKRMQEMGSIPIYFSHQSWGKPDFGPSTS